MTQIMDLLYLASDIQEALLFLPPVESGKDSITERQLRTVPIIDLRAYSETGEIHTSFFSYKMRARLDKANGVLRRQGVRALPQRQRIALVLRQRAKRAAATGA